MTPRRGDRRAMYARARRALASRASACWPRDAVASTSFARAQSAQSARAKSLGRGRACAARNVPTWATCDPEAMSRRTGGPATCANLINGTWRAPSTGETTERVVDPMAKDDVVVVAPKTNTEGEIAEVARSLASCPKSGLHNPFKAPERYLKYGEVSAKLAEEMRKPAVEEFFARLIQRVAPKSHAQALAEVVVTRKFLENFAGDNVRFLARGFSVSGDHLGQTSHGLRWPYGPVSVITPFNFPLEIPVLQLMGALFMGNKALVKSDTKVSIVLEQFIRLMLECGAPATDLDFINCDGAPMSAILR